MIIYRAIKHWKKAVFYSKLPCALYNIIFKYLKNYRMNWKSAISAEPC